MFERVLSSELYFKYFHFRRDKFLCGFEFDSEFNENYFAIQVFLPNSFFEVDMNNLSSTEQFIFNLNKDFIEELVQVKFELFAIGKIGELEAYVFKPWIMNIQHGFICNVLEDFILFMPQRIFFDLIHTSINLLLISVSQFKYVRVLQDLKDNLFRNYGLFLESVPDFFETKQFRAKRSIVSHNEAYINFDFNNCFEICNVRGEDFYFSFTKIWLEISEHGNRLNPVGFVKLRQGLNQFGEGLVFDLIIKNSYSDDEKISELIVGLIEYLTANSTICDLFVKINLMNLKAKSILLENNFVQINENIFGYSLISYFDYVEDLFNDGLIETAIMKEYAFKYYKYLEWKIHLIGIPYLYKIKLDFMNNFDFYRDFKRSSHQMIIDYFNKYGFGTNMPVLTYLSILAPIDRCVILENLFDINRLNSILSDKLLLAYVTSGKKELARLVIENSIRNGESELNVWALESKLDLGLAPFRNRDQRLALYNDFLCKTESILEIEFLNILIQFCKDSYEW